MDAEGWLTSELASFACAACGQAYGEAQARLIAQREELYFVDLSCPHCGSQAVAIVTIQLDGDDAVIETGRVVREDGATDEGRAAAPPISVDDVLDMHALLSGSGSDVTALLTRRDEPVR